jgi:hypothetical protein
MKKNHPNASIVLASRWCVEKSQISTKTKAKQPSNKQTNKQTKKNKKTKKTTTKTEQSTKEYKGYLYKCIFCSSSLYNKHNCFMSTFNFRHVLNS